MATFYGTQATKPVSQPAQLKAQGSEQAGIKVAYDEFTNAAAKSQNDVIKLMKLPAGARVLDCVVRISAALDAAGGTVDIGWEANAVDAADDDGLMANVDVTAAAVFSMCDDQGTRPGVHKQFDPLGGETQISATIDHAGGWDGTSGTLAVAIYYVVE